MVRRKEKPLRARSTPLPLFLFFLLHSVLLFASCQPVDKREVVVYTSVDQIFSQPVLQAFTRKTGIRVRPVFDTEETKSTGVVNRILAEAANPQADVFWSGDLFRVIFLYDKGLLAPYLSPAAEELPLMFRDPEGYWTGFSARARVLVYNTEKLSVEEVPRSLSDLAASRWKGQIAMANPLFGTTTVHMAALFVALGEERAQTFLNGLRANGLRLVSSNSESLRLVANGQVLVGLTDTDDAFVAKQDGQPIGVVFPDQDGMGTLIMPNAVCLIKGRPNPQGAKRLIDYLLSAEVEEALAQSAAQMPLRSGVTTPASVPRVDRLMPMQVPYRAVAEEMSRIQPFLKEWAGY